MRFKDQGLPSGTVAASVCFNCRILQIFLIQLLIQSSLGKVPGTKLGMLPKGTWDIGVSLLGLCVNSWAHLHMVPKKLGENVRDEPWDRGHSISSKSGNCPGSNEPDTPFWWREIEEAPLQNLSINSGYCQELNNSCGVVGAL